MPKTSTEVSLKHDFGTRMNLHGEEDIQRVNYIHNIFCVLVPTDNDRNMESRRLVASYGLQDRLSPADVLSAFEAFLAQMRTLYGEATRVISRTGFSYPDDGCIVRGSMDFVYETPAGCVLVDFKSNPMGHSVLDKASGHYAGNYNTSSVVMPPPRQVRQNSHPASGLLPRHRPPRRIAVAFRPLPELL